jgi:osmotically-inducible protein OsmY
MKNLIVKVRSICAVTGGVLLLSGLSGCTAFQQLRQCGFSECPSDAKITADVEKRLFEHTLSVSPNEIDVNTFNRVVYLSGAVDTRTVKVDAEVIARQTPGVADVVNSLVGHEP